MGAASKSLLFCVFAFSFAAMALPRPKRAIRPAPYQSTSCEVGLARSQAPLLLPGIRVAGRVSHAEQPHVSLHLAKPVAGRVARKPALAESCELLEQSAREREDAERPKYASLWVEQARLVAESSIGLQVISDYSDIVILLLFMSRAPTTPKKHLSGRRVWASFCATAEWNMGAPSFQQVLDFLQC